MTGRVLEGTLHDLRYGARALRRAPGFTVTALVTLAVTIGALSTVFSLANALLFRPPGVVDPESLVVVTSTRRQGRVLGSVSYPDYARVRDRTTTLRVLAAHYSTSPLWVTANGRSRELNGAVVSASYFPVLGLRPALGRFFGEDEDHVPDRDRVAVLSHGMWRDWFGASPQAIGATVRINAVPFTVIGVAPESFRGLYSGPNDVYILTMMLSVGYRWCADALAEDCTMLRMIGRLADGRTVAQARAEIAALVPARWATAEEGDNTGLTAFQPGGADLDTEPAISRSENGRLVMLLSLVAGLLLLVCCANLAGLLIARGSARARELAIRTSLGARRLRLVRQLMTESFLLAVSGGVLGLLVSLGVTRFLQARFYSVGYDGSPKVVDLRPDPVVVLAIFGVSVAAAFLFGLLPALKSIGAAGAESLERQPAGASPPSRLARSLVGVQAAVAVGLVAVAVLLMASARSMAEGANFDPSHVALLRLRPRLVEYPPEKAQAFQREVVRRLESIAGVASVTLVGTGAAPFLGSGEVSRPEWPAAGREALRTGYGEVGPRYFETLRTPVLRGREFEDRDRLGAPPVAVVNQTLARRLWAAGDVVGAPLLVNGRAHVVVGIVADVPLHSRGEEQKPFVYVSYWQNPGQVDARYCVRVRGDAAAMLPALVREVNRLDPDVPVTDTVTMTFFMAQAMLQPVRLNAAFLGYAAGLAVLLSALGLYGTLAFSVSRRSKEIGIRMALGAATRDVFSLILGEGMTAVLGGVAVGVGLALAGARLVRHLLYASAVPDAAVFALASLLVAGVGLCACAIPARRAARVEPMVALRVE